MKNNKGITLIALVITVMVLIILAAVSITALTDEDKGVVTKAKRAALKTEESTEAEKDEIDGILEYTGTEGNSNNNAQADSSIAQFGRVYNGPVGEDLSLGTYCVTRNAYPVLIIRQDNIETINFYIKDNAGVYKAADVSWASNINQNIGSSMSGDLPSAGEFVAFKIADPSKSYNLKVEFVHVSGAKKYLECTTEEFVKCQFEYKDASGVTKTTVAGAEKGGALAKVPVPEIYTSGSYKYIFNKWVVKGTSTTVSNFNNMTANQTLTAVYTQELNESVCFVAGTKVLTENGLVNIEDIKVGMKVYSFNEETEQVELKEVRNTFINVGKKDMVKTTVNGDVIESTSRHEFYVVGKGWMPAFKLEKGDILLNNEGEEVFVENVELIISEGNEVTVYNMEVIDNHNYFVGEEGILVHNSDSPC